MPTRLDHEATVVGQPAAARQQLGGRELRQESVHRFRIRVARYRSNPTLPQPEHERLQGLPRQVGRFGDVHKPRERLESGLVPDDRLVRDVLQVPPFRDELREQLNHETEAPSRAIGLGPLALSS